MFLEECGQHTVATADYGPEQTQTLLVPQVVVVISHLHTLVPGHCSQPALVTPHFPSLLGIEVVVVFISQSWPSPAHFAFIQTTQTSSPTFWQFGLPTQLLPSHRFPVVSPTWYGGTHFFEALDGGQDPYAIETPPNRAIAAKKMLVRVVMVFHLSIVGVTARGVPPYQLSSATGPRLINLLRRPWLTR